MKNSRDVKALFDRFGGDASSYQEIRMENEALDARRRWPLLGMIDPRQTEVSAAGSPAPAAEADADHPAAAAGTRGQGASRNRTHAVLRSTAPLFTRSPRRDVPPVIVKAPPPAGPEGSTYRFTPPPAEPAAGPAPALAATPAPAAGTELATAPAPAATPLPAIAPRLVRPVRVTALPAAGAAAAPEAGQPIAPAADAAAMFARLASPGRARAASTEIFPAPLGAAPAAAPSCAPSLKKLAGAPAAPAHDAERLDALFSRLRRGGTAPSPQIAVMPTAAAPKAAARRPWFLGGAGQS
ncbi:cellulose biosynthesis protein BcsP [Burkholderia glumae]|uniref:cellulose biosynthesis protein BcsP n=1 Tax=Burkholderia glumae TaxID=337 RepID=UPI0022A7CF16|nr:cellulose biosynthesis protein BcsP [Burkholderia glumae]